MAKELRARTIRCYSWRVLETTHSTAREARRRLIGAAGVRAAEELAAQAPPLTADQEGLIGSVLRGAAKRINESAGARDAAKISA